MAATKSKTIDPWKLKKWYPILAPEYMRKAFIGETPCESPEKVVNKEINISLAAVTGEIRKQSTNMTFRVIGFEGNNAITQVTRIEVSPSYIKRNVRKGRTRADDAFILKTADDEEIKIKPIIIT
ncbi:hypothetical protein KY308_04060, partial [Candidatus Woesearchaeota archaeon]|nr:hypothetical protein [Candidatus Woesearchaeota archaeon]